MKPLNTALQLTFVLVAAWFASGCEKRPNGTEVVVPINPTLFSDIRPRDAKGTIVFVLDDSGSMADGKLNIVKDVMINKYMYLFDIDYAIGLVPLNSERCTTEPCPSGNYACQRGGISYTQSEWIAKQCEGIYPGGSTPLVASMKRAQEMLNDSPYKGRMIMILLTDGVADHESEVPDAVRNVLSQGTELFAIGFAAEGLALQEAIRANANGKGKFFSTDADPKALSDTMDSILTAIE